MAHQKTEALKFRALGVSAGISLLILSIGLLFLEDLGVDRLVGGLAWPLVRLMVFITLGLAVGQMIEGTGWTHKLALLAAPLFAFGRLGQRCSAAFTTAFFSGVAANAMLVEFYHQGKITRKQLYLSNFINQMPAYFLHLPTTFFIVIPLTRWAGGLYFLLTFIAMVFRTGVLIVYGHFQRDLPGFEHWREPIPQDQTTAEKAPLKGWAAVRKRLPGRIIRVAVWVLPIYVSVYVLNIIGMFDMMRHWMAQTVTTQFIPVESLSVVILSFAAEFTSGFAAAGALLDAGVLTVKQTVIALLVGNIVAFPVRAIRHQLPRYMGIFSPKMGSQILLMGQGLRVASLIIVGIVYYWVA